MRISIRKRFVFLSNPRCGSQSIRAMLQPYSDILSTVEKPFHHHSNARVIKRALKRLDFDWEEFYSFTTIRNPWARAASFWEYGGLNEASVWNRRRAESSDFHEFCQKVPPGLGALKFAGNGEKVIVSEVIRLEDLNKRFPKLAKELNTPLESKRGRPVV